MSRQDSDPPIHDVFTFKPDGQFLFSDDFHTAFDRSTNTFIILFIGNGRVGKSTRLNQLLTKVLAPEAPFESYGGSDPVTKQFQFCGPLKFKDFGDIHGLKLTVDSDPDVFLIDCEGLHSLSETMPCLKQATFALAQMASLTVLVMKDTFNHENRDSVCSLFTLSRAFSREIPDFFPVTVIIERDIGVSCPRSKPLDEKNRLRREQDIKRGKEIRAFLNHGLLKFSPDDFSVLTQPQFTDPDFYWSSINDFLMIAQGAAQRRPPFAATRLLDFFDEALPHIMDVTDFENPNIPFKKILLKVIDRRLTEAQNHALLLCDQYIEAPILSLSQDELKRYSEIPYIVNGIQGIVTAFIDKANQLHPHILEYCKEITDEFHRTLHQKIEDIARSACLKRCSVLFPMIQAQCLTELKARIQEEIGPIQASDVCNYAFSELCSMWEGRGAAMLRAEAEGLHNDFPSSPSFGSSVEKLRNDISAFVKELENEKMAELQQVQEEQRAKCEEDCNTKIDSIKATELANRQALEDKHKDELREAEAKLANEKREKESQLAIMEERNRGEKEQIKAMQDAITRAEAIRQEELRQHREDQRKSDEAFREYMRSMRERDDARHKEMLQAIEDSKSDCSVA
jgi:hypothetical protein